MNWYKAGQSLSNLTDRNDLNHKIKTFEEFGTSLLFLSKYVYQNAPHARQAVYMIATDKKLSSYPDLQSLLLGAYKIGRDSYKKFAEICGKVVEKIAGIVTLMKQERTDFSNERLPQRIKDKINHG